MESEGDIRIWDHIIDAIPSAVVIVRADGSLALFNRRWQEIYGESPQGIDLQRHIERMKPLRPDRTPIKYDDLPGIQTLANGGLIRNQEMIIHNKDGSELPVLVSSAPLIDEHGAVAAAVVVIDDILEYKRIQRTLAESERDLARQSFLLKLSEAMRPVEDAVDIQNLITRMLGEHLGVERALYGEMDDESLFEVKRDYHLPGLKSFAGRYALSAAAPVLVRQLQAGKTNVVENVFSEYSLTESERRIYEERELTAFIMVPLVKAGRMVAFLRVQCRQPHNWDKGDVKLVEEVAERTWAAVERARAEETLREAERTYRFQAHLLEKVHDAIIATDHRYRITYWNETAEKIFGWSTREAVGRRLLALMRTMDVAASGEAAIASMIRQDNFSGEIKYQRKNGQVLFLDVQTSAIRDQQGHIQETISSIRDVTVRKKAELKLKESERRAKSLVEQLQRYDKNRNDFLNSLSHELRNPLAAIMSSVDVLALSASDNARVNRVVPVMKRQINHLTRLVDDLLDVTRIMNNKIRLHKEPIDLVDLLHCAIGDILPQYQKKGVCLETNIPGHRVPVLGDAQRLSQVVSNLLHNALKFTKAGGQVMVAAVQDAAAGEACVSVSDNGEGIAPELLSDIFEAFSQAEQTLARSQGGLGLGLSIARGIVDMHGGTIRAASDGYGKGSTFTIRLPLHREDN